MKIWILLLAFTALSFAALPRIVIKGQRMYDDTGKQFFCRGVAYAPSPASNSADPLSNLTAIQRDIPVLKSLNVNCIRVYQYFAFSNIKASMEALDAAGIYVLVDLYDPNDNINRDFPDWHTYLFQIFQAKIDKVAVYPNLLGIIAGNEVANSIATTPSSAYTKAAIRDLKAYVAKKYTTFKVPIGYSTADDGDLRDNLQNYFACGTSAESADFYGINIYRWCSNNNNPESTYSVVLNDYLNYPVPTILTEFGCILQGKTRFERQFTDVPYIFGSPFNQAFSGAVAYEYHTSRSSLRPEGSYGIVDFNPAETTATLNAEGRNLAAKYAAVTQVNGTQTMSDYTPTPRVVNCPTKSANWKVNTTILPPTPDVDRCVCLNNQFHCRTKVQNPADLTNKYGDTLSAVIDYICGKSPVFCANLVHDSSTGVYGRYSSCPPLIRASLVLNYQYLNSTMCEFGQDANFQEFVENTPTPSGVCQNYGDSASLQDIGITPTQNTVNPITDDDTNRASFNTVPSTNAELPDSTSSAASSNSGTGSSPQNSNGASNTNTFNSSASSVAVSVFALVAVVATLF